MSRRENTARKARRARFLKPSALRHVETTMSTVTTPAVSSTTTASFAQGQGDVEGVDALTQQMAGHTISNTAPPPLETPSQMQM